MWKILGIEQTKDKKIIKEAYLNKVKEVNPEDKPEEFKELRQAYEQALQFADEKETLNKNDPNFTILKSFDEIYDDMMKRCSLDAWKTLLSGSLFSSLDTRNSTIDQLVIYLDTHWNMPMDVMKYLVAQLKMEENADHFIELVGQESVDWFIYDVSCCERILPANLYTPGIDGKACDEYMQLFLSIRNDNEKEIFEKMNSFTEFHPYARVYDLLSRPEGEERDEQIKELLKEYPSEWPLRERYIRSLDWETQQEKIKELIFEADDGRFDDIAQFHLSKGIVCLKENKLLDAVKCFNEASALAIIGTDLYLTADNYYENTLSKFNDELKNTGIENIDDNQILYEGFFAAANAQDIETAKEIFKRINMELLDDYQCSVLNGNYELAINGEDEKMYEYYRQTYEILCNTPDDSHENHRRLRRKDRILQNIIMHDVSLKKISFEDAYKIMLERMEEHFKIDYFMSVEYCRQKKYDEALTCANRALKSQPKNSLALFGKAFVHYCRDEDAMAIHFANDAVNENSTNFPAMMLKALILIQYDEFDRVREVLQQLEEIGIVNSVIGDYCNAIMLYRKSGDYDGAFKILKSVRERIDDAEIPLQKAKILYTCAFVEEKVWNGDFDEMVKILMHRAEEILQEDDAYYNALILKARMFKAMGRKEEMLKILYQLKEDPRHTTWVENQIGYEYFRNVNTNPQRVIDIFKESFNLHRSSEPPWYIGTAYFVQQRYDEALEMFNLEIEVDPNDWDGYAAMAEVYMTMGDYEKALEEIDKAIAIIKDDEQVDGDNVYDIKLRILYRSNRLKEALQFATEALSYANCKSKIRNLMMCYVYNGIANEGIKIIDRKLRESQNRHKECIYQKFIYCLNENKLIEAKVILKRFKNIVGEITTSKWENIMRDFDRDFAGIIRYYLNELKDMDKQNDDCSYQMGNIAKNYFYLGRYTEARHYAEMAVMHCNRQLESFITDRPLYLTRKAQALMILGKEQQARECMLQARQIPLCRKCNCTFCKDALLNEIFIEEAKGNYSKAIELCQKGIDANTGETDFVSDMNRIKKNIKRK